MIEVGTLCMKIAGRDAGKRGVVIKVEKNRAVVDGETRRKTVSLKHLIPVGKMDIKENASHEDVVKAFSKINVKLSEKKPKIKDSEKKEEVKKTAKKSKK